MRIYFVYPSQTFFSEPENILHEKKYTDENFLYPGWDFGIVEKGLFFFIKIFLRNYFLRIWKKKFYTVTKSALLKPLSSLRTILNNRHHTQLHHIPRVVVVLLVLLPAPPVLFSCSCSSFH
jgi:hypothetical protein